MFRDITCNDTWTLHKINLVVAFVVACPFVSFLFPYAYNQTTEIGVEVNSFSYLLSISCIIFLFSSHPIFVVQFFLISFSELRYLGAFQVSRHAFNGSGVLPWSMHGLCRPIFELSRRFMPLRCLRPHLSFVLSTNNKCGPRHCNSIMRTVSRLRMKMVAQKAVLHSLFNGQPCRQVVDMERKMLHVEHTEPGTIIEIIWWNSLNQYKCLTSRLIMGDKWKNHQIVLPVAFNPLVN